VRLAQALSDGIFAASSARSSCESPMTVLCHGLHAIEALYMTLHVTSRQGPRWSIAVPVRARVNTVRSRINAIFKRVLASRVIENTSAYRRAQRPFPLLMAIL
jgi:hypothetical protein